MDSGVFTDSGLGLAGKLACGEERLHVLIVDDELEIRGYLCEILKGFGYEVSSARNGREVLDRIAARPRRSCSTAYSASSHLLIGSAPV